LRCRYAREKQHTNNHGNKSWRFHQLSFIAMCRRVKPIVNVDPSFFLTAAHCHHAAQARRVPVDHCAAVDHCASVTRLAPGDRYAAVARFAPEDRYAAVDRCAAEDHCAAADRCAAVDHCAAEDRCAQVVRTSVALFVAEDWSAPVPQYVVRQGPVLA
jgi:hypothetical protein